MSSVLNGNKSSTCSYSPYSSKQLKLMNFQLYDARKMDVRFPLILTESIAVGLRIKRVSSKVSCYTPYFLPTIRILRGMKISYILPLCPQPPS